MSHSFLSALFLASQSFLLIADEMPVFDAAKGCRATNSVAGDRYDRCIRDENSARDELSKQWSQFSASQRRQCSQEVRGFEPSYVELLTCLQMARDAKTMPQD
jgi:hypothetical protein